MVDLCHLSADEGPCDEFQTAFYYSAKVDRCEQFTWGGCGGNANRFASREDCERRCRQQNTIRRPPTAQHDGKDKDCSGILWAWGLRMGGKYEGEAVPSPL